MCWVQQGQWVVVAFLLVDAAPTFSSCRSSAPEPLAIVEVSPPECACAPESIQVLIDGAAVGTLTCGVDGSLRVEVEPGTHVVAGASGGTSFAPQSVTVRAGDLKEVGLSCPAQ